MPKVLLLPLLQIPSGHHQVADAAARWLKRTVAGLEIEKVELLSDFHPFLERVISGTYLKWIHYSPKTYNWIYRQMAYKSEGFSWQYRAYELVFLRRMQEIIDRSSPDVIICSHGFPSYLCSRLKVLGCNTIPVVNIYTDFFINNVWGKAGIDLHCVPNAEMKEVLIKQGVDERKIFVTGIPVDQAFYTPSVRLSRNGTKGGKIRLLVAGGSIGVGLDQTLLQQMINGERIVYYLLCGKNERLYREIAAMGLEHITPLPYIDSRERMSQIYAEMDGILTKPGGVTVSECLYKRLPIFIHSALPGQEEINLSFLRKRGLVFVLDPHLPLETNILRIINNPEECHRWVERVERYIGGLEWENALARMVEILV